MEKLFAQFAKLALGRYRSDLARLLAGDHAGRLRDFLHQQSRDRHRHDHRLAQFVAEELDVPFDKVKMDSGDTIKTIEQGSTVGSRTIERAGPQIRQAAAAARHELLKLASAQFGAPVDKLTVVDGVVSVSGDASKADFLRPTDRRQEDSTPRSPPPAPVGT